MPQWTVFPHRGDFRCDADKLKRLWGRLHQGDAEDLPQDPATLAAWALFHQGDFYEATQAGLKAGGAGITAANKATCIYATYLEKKEKTRLDLYLDVAQRCEAQLADDPQCASAHYWHAYALGRYSQGISVAKALALGLGSKVKTSLETTIKLQPRHADAHIALGTFHAEVIDKVGSLIGGMTYGAKKDTGLKMFQQALLLSPQSAIGLIEYANGLVMFEGDKKLAEATLMYEQAASLKPLDAMEWLDGELARTELAA